MPLSRNIATRRILKSTRRTASIVLSRSAGPSSSIRFDPGYSTMSSTPQSELAPSGTLRVGINFGNTLLANRDKEGNPRGIALDLAHELARRAGIPLEMVSYGTAGRMADGAKAGAWDVAFLATDPDRAAEI